MNSLNTFNQPLQLVFTDIDDTLTKDGQLPAESYSKLWELHKKGVSIVPVTGRPAGWCEMIARMWPVAAVIGENGAFYFEYKNQKMNRVFVTDENTRLENQKKLKTIEQEVFKNVPGSALASDQFTRLFDLAIDFCEDVPALGQADIDKIVSVFKKHGATAKVSSIHVNGWFGEYDKKTMCEIYYKNVFGKELKENLKSCAFIGDSPNDEPLFAFFENSFAVANIKKFKSQLTHFPAFVTPSEGAQGFVEFGNQVLKTL